VGRESSFTPWCACVKHAVKETGDDNSQIQKLEWHDADALKDNIGQKEMPTWFQLETTTTME
jgi:hypothetical protein